MVSQFWSMLRDDRAAVMVEYAIIAAATAVPLIVAETLIVAGAGSRLTSVTNGMVNLGTTPP